MRLPTRPSRGGRGRIASIQQTNLNIGNIHLNGVDVDLKWRFYNGPNGKLTARLYGTSYNKYDAQNTDGTYSNQIDVGGGINQGLIPRWKHVATLDYDYGRWGATVGRASHKKDSGIASAGLFCATCRKLSVSEP